MSYTTASSDVVTFTKGMLEVRIFHTREAMGKEAAINVSDSIQRLLKQKEEINIDVYKRQGYEKF